jgi:hypothetical protein
MEVVHLDHEFIGYYLWRKSFFERKRAIVADVQTVFIATASLLFLSDKFQFNPEAVSISLISLEMYLTTRTLGSWHS